MKKIPAKSLLIFFTAGILLHFLYVKNICDFEIAHHQNYIMQVIMYYIPAVIIFLLKISDILLIVFNIKDKYFKIYKVTEIIIVVLSSIYILYCFYSITLELFINKIYELKPEL